MTSPLRRTLHVLVIFLIAVWLFPVYWIILTSLKPDTVINSRLPVIIFKPTLSNYGDLFGQFDFARILWNSLFIVVLATSITMALAVSSAYALTRLKFARADTVALLILSFRFMPGIVVVLPYYLVFQGLSLIDTYRGMILIYTAFGLPFAVWILRGYMMDLPRDIEEAARLDGLRRWHIIWRIILPLARPGIAVTAIFTFIFNWNEYLFAFFLTQDHAVTVPVQISKMVGAYTILWGDVSAAVALQLLPLIVMVFLLQRHVTRGLALGVVR